METTMVSTKWYAIRVIAGKEKEALKNLRFELEVNNMDRYIEDIVLPIERKFSLRKGEKVSREKLIFPGYLLISCKMSSELDKVIKRTNMVIEVSGDKGRPTPMRDVEVERILSQMEESMKDEKIPFIVGEIVEINDGAFSGFTGTITEVDNHKKTLKINVPIFGRDTPVVLDYLQVNKNF